MKEKKAKRLKKFKNSRFIESVMVLTEMIFALRFLSTVEDLNTFKTTILVVFFAVTTADAVKAARLGKAEGVMFYKFIILSCEFFLGFIWILLTNRIFDTLIAAYITYAITLITARICSMVKNHKAYNIVINILRILPVLIMFIVPGIESQATNEVTVSLIIILLVFIWLQSLIRLIGISVSNIRLEILKKIIEKSMAVQILSGLLLLIVSFSFVFEMLEDSINTYGDALWYCFAIVTTIGFGDITVTGYISRVLSVILGIYGIVVVSLITSIIINFYSETKDLKTEDSDSGDGEDDSDSEETAEPAITEESKEGKEPEPAK